MGTHRINEDVERRLWRWAYEKGQTNISHMTVNNCVDELLRKEGF